MLPLITRVNPSVPAQNLFVSKYKSTPLVGPPRSRGGTLGLWREIFCFVRNGYSIEVPTNDPIFDYCLKSHRFWREPLRNKFPTKQLSLFTIFHETCFGATPAGSGIMGSYDNITLQRPGQIDSTHATNCLILLPSTRSNYISENARKRVWGNKMPKFRQVLLPVFYDAKPLICCPLAYVFIQLLQASENATCKHIDCIGVGCTRSFCKATFVMYVAQSTQSWACSVDDQQLQSSRIKPFL
jgi:hypothetical protein